MNIEIQKCSDFTFRSILINGHYVGRAHLYRVKGWYWKSYFPTPGTSDGFFGTPEEAAEDLYYHNFAHKL